MSLVALPVMAEIMGVRRVAWAVCEVENDEPRPIFLLRAAWMMQLPEPVWPELAAANDAGEQHT